MCYGLYLPFPSLSGEWLHCALATDIVVVNAKPVMCYGLYLPFPSLSGEWLHCALATDIVVVNTNL